MLTMPTFQDEPERVVELIQAHLTTDAASPAAILARQAQDRIAETRRLQRLLGQPLGRRRARSSLDPESHTSVNARGSSRRSSIRACDTSRSRWATSW